MAIVLLIMVHTSKVNASWLLRSSSVHESLFSASEKVEEETIPEYVATRYYPVRIGQIFRNRYQVLGKLGFEITSTVWLARDLDKCRHIALKLYIKSDNLGNELDTELDVYKRIANSPDHHPGHNAVRSLLDSFEINTPQGRHRCLVHGPLWDRALNIKHRNPVRRLPQPIMAFLLKRLFLALNLLHRECHIAHTDIKRSFGEPVLCDFGSAVPLVDGLEHCEDIQPDIYRAPEVLLDIPWTYSADIWKVGCMIRVSSGGENLFTGRDPEHGTYRGRAHLAEMIALLGPPPTSLLARANLSSKFFSEAGIFSAGTPIPPSRPLDDRESPLQGEKDKEDREVFLRFMRKMLQWEPETRSSAQELAEDGWILKHTT
ncbi:hypothetical protein MBLNU13_g05463t1 [Cladosporium sp. NU13]